MGRIRKSSTGKWFVDLWIDGKRYRKVIGKDKHLASLALKDLEVKAQRHQLGFLEQRHISIEGFFKEYEEYSKANHRLGTQTRYRAVMRDFLNFLKYKEPHICQLRAVTLDTIEKYKIYRRTQTIARNGRYGELYRVNLKHASSGVKASTINFEISSLKSIFYHALKLKYLDVNPAKGVPKIKTDDIQRRRFLSDNECKVLLNTMPKEYYPIFYTYMGTGMRRSELVNLEWTDIDLINRTIKIQRKPFWYPKTGEREIPMNDSLYAVLSTLPKRINFVFCTNKNEKLDPDKLRRILIEIATQAGIKDLTQLHALRHTFASRLIAKGVDLPSVQKLMGHNRIETTMIYTHQTTEHLRNAISKLDILN